MNKKPNTPELNATDLIANAESWSQSDIENRAAAVVLRDATTGSSYIHFAGTPNDIAKAVVDLMSEDSEIALAIFGAVTVTGLKMFPDDVVNRVTATAQKIADLRRNGATDADVGRIMLGKNENV